MKEMSSRKKSKSPDKSRQSNRIKGTSTSQMSFISKKETPSVLIDNTLEKIDEFEIKKKIVNDK